MKYIIQTIIIICITALSYFKVNGQADVLNHVASSSSNYVGWDATSTNPDLNIAHYNAKNINFLTNGNKHATIDASGNLAIGLYDHTNATHHPTGRAAPVGCKIQTLANCVSSPPGYKA